LPLISKRYRFIVLYKEEKANMQIAPNTNFSVPIALKGQPLKPGDYHLSMTVVGYLVQFACLLFPLYIKLLHVPFW
jgi:hypothetical protein